MVDRHRRETLLCNLLHQVQVLFIHQKKKGIKLIKLPTSVKATQSSEKDLGLDT